MKHIEARVDFKREIYSAFLKAALCATTSQETCGMCGEALDDPQNAVRVTEVISIDGNEGLPIVDHPHFARRVFGPAQSFPVGLEIADLLRAELGGKCICQKCRDALKESGITLTK